MSEQRHQAYQTVIETEHIRVTKRCGSRGVCG
jgi:hypothetical protein